ncbi:hypothetical protein L6R52_04035 [Myxococcota bacterium]|nr:hypothetical protein [Myxococcota bacterium]
MSTGATAGAGSADLARMNALLAIDLDAAEAYACAIARLENGADREQLARFLDEQRRHVGTMCAAIADAGGLPCSAGDVTSVLTKAKLLLGSLIGDQAILRVMRVNEDEASTAYRHALPVPEPFDALVQRQLEALRHRRGWYVRRLGILEMVMEP